MGIKQTDLVPLSAIYPTAISPASKSPKEKYFQVARTDTASKTVAVLSADSSIISVSAFPGTASNAGTTGTVTITVTKDGSSISTGTFNAVSNGAAGGAVTMTNLPNLETLPPGGDIIVTAVYAETGTASTAGGPFVFRVVFVR